MMKCPICRGDAHYFPSSSIIIGRGHIICKEDRSHTTKAYHIVVDIKGDLCKVIVLTDKEELLKIINENPK